MIRNCINQHVYIYLCINRASVSTKCKSAAGISKLVFHNNSVWCNELLRALKMISIKILTGVVDQLLWMVIKKPPRLVAKKLQKSEIVS
jgi:hypothetical protein